MAIITYDGSTLATISKGHKAIVSCANKEMSDNVVVKAENNTGSIRVFYDNKVIASLPGEGTATLVCKEKTMMSDIIVVAELKIISEGLKFASNGNGTCTLVGIGTCTDTDIVIPNTSLKGEPVTAIGANAFYDNDTITGVHIPNGVTTIREDAFAYCASLANVTFEENSQLKTMDSYAFYNCRALESIIMPDNLTSIGRFAFSGCNSIKRVHLSKSLAEFSRDLFEYCSNIETLTVSAGNPNYYSAGNCIIETATGTLVLGCKNSVIPTEGVTKIGNSAFTESDITSVVIPASVTLIDWYAFKSCTGLTSVTFSEDSQLKNIQYESFRNCSALTNITLPNGLKYIGDSVFQNCVNLTSVYLPSSLMEIGRSVFYACAKLTGISIPDSVVSIGRGAFSGCDGLIQKVNGISYVGKWAVACETTLTSVQIRAGTVGIGESMCNGSAYSAITNVSLPSGLKYISDFAFTGCSELTSIKIPDTVVKLGLGVFGGCGKLNQLENGVVYVDKWATSDFNHEGPSLVIREDTVGISDYAFSANSFELGHIESVVIPDSVKSIGVVAFRGAHITTVTIPSSVSRIWHSAFKECELLTTINVPWSSSDARNADAPWGAPNATIIYNYTGE